jgi:eukaryotic-like serine/threonine-protein kinase
MKGAGSSLPRDVLRLVCSAGYGRRGTCYGEFWTIYPFESPQLQVRWCSRTMNTGDLITPNLKLVRLLGQGGMGSVWLAKNLAIDSDVAIKFITGEFAQDQAVRERFKREAAMAAKVKSPHIVQVYDHGVTEDGSAYIVMEHLQGEELAERLLRERVLPPETVVTIIHQAAKGLARAHQAGVVHRDIKPSNIFLVDNEDGEIFVKIVDFGIAKIDDNMQPSAMTSTRAMLGTPFYMSPEQVVSAKTADLRTDLWSLAVVAYECLTGNVPFSGETLGALFIAINNGEFERATKRAPTLPRSIDVWFKKTLEKARQERYQSAREFADALRAALPIMKLEAETTGQFPLVSVAPPAKVGEFAATNAGTAPGAAIPKAPTLPSDLRAISLMSVDVASAATAAGTADAGAGRESASLGSSVADNGERGEPSKPGRSLWIGAAVLGLVGVGALVAFAAAGTGTPTIAGTPGIAAVSVAASNEPTHSLASATPAAAISLLPIAETIAMASPTLVPSATVVRAASLTSRTTTKPTAAPIVTATAAPPVVSVVGAKDHGF